MDPECRASGSARVGAAVAGASEVAVVVSLAAAAAQEAAAPLVAGNSMARLSKSDHDRVLAAISAAEKRTAAEFAVAIVTSADEYAELRLLVPALIAILSSPLLLATGLSYDPFWLAVTPCLLFLLIAGILMPDAVAVPLVPIRLRSGRARRLAQSLFVELGLAAPRDRAGVLLFVAHAERQVEILAGAGIDERVDRKIWQAIVDDFVQAARSGPLAQALIAAIESSTIVLSKAFPASDDNRNEVPNRLVEL
jgi:putative membrane protein